jgi:threonine aldolase
MRDEARAERARDVRHRLGGAMRQAGVLAAAGSHALHHHLARLTEDHARATRLAEGIAAAAPGVVERDSVETNMVLLDLTGAPVDTVGLDAACREAGILISPLGPRRVRLVTHLDIDDDGVDRALAVITSALAA